MPSLSYTSKKSFNGIHGNSQLTFQFKVTCGNNFYGRNCATRCVGQNSVANGFYTCSSEGERVCLAGWTGPACNKGKLVVYKHIWCRSLEENKDDLVMHNHQNKQFIVTHVDETHRLYR